MANIAPHLPSQTTAPRAAAGPPSAAGAMVVCGDGPLADRLTAELQNLYGETVTLVVPGSGDAPAGNTDEPTGRASILFGRISAALGGIGNGGSHGQGVTEDTPAYGTAHGGHAPADRIIEAPELTQAVLARAGVAQAAALALVHDDDETNIRAALAARRLNPRLRLVIRLYNRRLGQHLEQLLDQAAEIAAPGRPAPDRDSSTTVLSDADTAAPALAAAAVAGSSKVVQAGGLLLRAAEIGAGRGPLREAPSVAAGQRARLAPYGPGGPAQGLATLALLSATDSDPAGAEGSDASGEDARPDLLPDDTAVASAHGRGRVVLTTVSYSGPSPTSRRTGVLLGSVLSKRLRWSFLSLVGAVLALAIASMLFTGDPPLHSLYLTLLDLYGIDDPATEGTYARKTLQLLTGTAGLLLLPVITAAVLEALGSFRSSAVTRRPPRGLSDHVVLLGLGKIGTRVLLELRRLNIPVVCVEADPEARGVPVARRLRVPVVIGDVTHEGVLEAAKIHRARALLALTSLDTINLEAALAARAVEPRLRVVLRLYDDDFATVVYRTLRSAHPRALTRSRSVSHLAGPAFAAAMMGRQILGAIPVERRVLLFAAIDVAGHPRLEGRTVAGAFRPGQWRILALDRANAHDSGVHRTDGIMWDLDPGHVLSPGERVVIAATRGGLAELLGRRYR